MFQTLYSTAALVALCVLLTAAIWRGGPSEQAGAGIYAFGWLATSLARYSTDEYALVGLGVDAAVLLGFVLLAWRSHRRWPLLAVAFQAVAVASGALYLVMPTTPQTVYFGGAILSTFGVLATIAWGVYASITEKKSASSTTT